MAGPLKFSLLRPEKVQINCRDWALSRMGAHSRMGAVSQKYRTYGISNSHAHGINSPLPGISTILDDLPLAFSTVQLYNPAMSL